MPLWSKEFLDIQTTTECRFTLKRVCDMTRIHSSSAYRSKQFIIILGTKFNNKMSLCINVTKTKDFLLRRVLTDQELNFKLYVEITCCIAKYELYTLQRIWSYISVNKTKFLVNTFISSDFYVSMTWMFAGKTRY